MCIVDLTAHIYFIYFSFLKQGWASTDHTNFSAIVLVTLADSALFSSTESVKHTAYSLVS